MALFENRDELIAELRADKARLIMENEELRKTLLSLTDARAYAMRHRPVTSSNPVTHPNIATTPADFRAKLFKPERSFEEIAKAFEKRA